MSDARQTIETLSPEDTGVTATLVFVRDETKRDPHTIEVNVRKPGRHLRLRHWSLAHCSPKTRSTRLARAKRWMRQQVEELATEPETQEATR